MHVPLAPIQHTYPIVHYNQAEGMIAGLGNPEPFFGHGEPLRERTTFGVAEAQPGPRDGRDKNAICAKAFIEQIALEGRHIPRKTLDGLRIGSRVVIGPTQDEMRLDLQADMPERCGRGQGALAVDDGVVHLARHPERGTHVGGDPSEPQRDRPASGRGSRRGASGRVSAQGLLLEH